MVQYDTESRDQTVADRFKVQDPHRMRAPVSNNGGFEAQEATNQEVGICRKLPEFWDMADALILEQCSNMVYKLLTYVSSCWSGTREQKKIIIIIMNKLMKSRFG